MGKHIIIDEFRLNLIRKNATATLNMSLIVNIISASGQYTDCTLTLLGYKEPD